ncbi:uncharacterized protein Eint_070660 [Encephalitozoon intestinalis ATCC 50506]|uniref:Mediator of RNA polymerase II transcription subunit 18 n=1 Tax=Encephalitozoon intestinalis (strain ATCC 50506) TaxID=876142 RepID=E0S7Z5_ENCIT|nr:uncharacterized protein Eint_070660 [Encephalitozoon intestinalis ATCC 50506]ADM11830.1 hypothetical protein Eint_070660 [Encephalitozoon intestinalis ATCC 50506]UTX45580.1 mediator of RNA polymerase II transcription subunit 18 [Encephalitozoon intestinalis]
MIECSVFGYLMEVDCICNHLKLHKRTDKTVSEAVYSNGTNVLLVSKEDDGIYLSSRGPPDRNKNRMSFCSRVQKSRIRTLDTLKEFLSSFGFELVREGQVELTTFEKGAGRIEISRSISDEGNSQEVDTGRYWLVKVFVTSENTQNGERMLSRLIEELEDQVQLIKPSIK